PCSVGLLVWMRTNDWMLPEPVGEVVLRRKIAPLIVPEVGPSGLVRSRTVGTVRSSRCSSCGRNVRAPRWRRERVTCTGLVLRKRERKKRTESGVMTGALQGCEGVMSFRDPKANKANQTNSPHQGRGPDAAKKSPLAEQGIMPNSSIGGRRITDAARIFHRG